MATFKETVEQYGPLTVIGMMVLVMLWILYRVIKGLGKFSWSDPKEKAQLKKIFVVFIVSILLILVGGYLTLWYVNNKRKKKGEKPFTIMEFINGGAKFNPITVLVGMVAGMMFGFIDNAGLYFGMDSLNPLFTKMGATGELAQSGLGNTFSDMLGGFLGTFAGIFIQTLSGKSDVPIWSEAIGLVVGCLIGVVVPKLIMGKTWDE